MSTHLDKIYHQLNSLLNTVKISFPNTERNALVFTMAVVIAWWTVELGNKQTTPSTT
jgi:hypothetical protein